MPSTEITNNGYSVVKVQTDEQLYPLADSISLLRPPQEVHNGKKIIPPCTLAQEH